MAFLFLEDRGDLKQRGGREMGLVNQIGEFLSRL